MTRRISDSQWDVYKKIINDAHDDFNQDTIVWVRQLHSMPRWGEDEGNSSSINIELKCLNAYNFFRSWPMTDESVAGKIDKESMVVMLNKEYLRGLGYLTTDGNFDFDPGADSFIFEGQKLTAAGETPLSQAHESPLHIMLILKREPTKTGSSKY